MFPISRMISSSLKTLVSPQNHQLLRQCPVSGTPKGKAKLKAGQLRKQSFRSKKGASAAPVASKTQKAAAERLARIEQACLNAPPPVRYLTAKQRQREAERERLGLISKDRQHEIDQAKARAKSGKEEVDEPGIIGTPGLDYISLGLVDKDAIPKYELTVEDGRRLAKEYSRFLMRKHRARRAAESALLNLKKEAIAALPEHLRQAAMVPDFSLFPANRHMAMLTPPIEGYAEKMKEAANKAIYKGKHR